MSYQYGESPVHGFATPEDDTPLDGTSWSHLVDGVGIGTPFVCASQAEQDDYLAAVTAAGYGPSSTSIIRVCRTDLDALVMRNDGLGWVREWGGSLIRDVYTTGAGSMSGGNPNRDVAAVTVDLPCAALVTVSADLKIEPITSGGWNLGFGLRDDTGTGLTGTRWYNKGDGLGLGFNAMLTRTVSLPAGSNRVRAFAAMTSESGALMLSNASLSVSYA